MPIAEQEKPKFKLGDLVKLSNEFFNHVHMVTEVFPPSVREGPLWQAGEGTAQMSTLTGFTYKVVSYDSQGHLYSSHLPEYSLELVHPGQGRIVRGVPFPNIQ